MDNVNKYKSISEYLKEKLRSESVKKSIFRKSPRENSG
jgi:hypothetical protein